MMAANYLQTLNWHNDATIMKNIITFYSKAKAYDSISTFYEGCAQIEIDEYRDYEKALQAYREAQKYNGKSRSIDKDKRDDVPEKAIEAFHKAIDNVKPNVEVRSKRVGGANYQVPMPVTQRRRQSLAFRWIITATRAEKGKPMAERLARELYDAACGEGKAVNVREQTHRMAEANKAFSHFRF